MELEVQEWLLERIEAGPLLVHQLLENRAGGGEFHRQVYSDLQKQLNTFLKSPRGSKWVIMPGLRGVGKTTLLAQLFENPSIKEHPRFYLSLDAARRVGANMIDVEKALEAALGHKLEANRKPVLLFLDEVHFLSDWSLAVKTWIDNSERLFVICTGSSALTLKSSSEIGRRADVIKVGPLSFGEFVAIRQTQKNQELASQLPDRELGQQIKAALFESGDIKEVDKKLRRIMPRIDDYWSSLDEEADINGYLLYGTLPFALGLQQTEGEMFDLVVWERIMQTIDNVLLKDIAWLEKFDNHVLASFPKLLFALTHTDSRSLHKLARALKLNIATVQSMLAVLVQTEIIMDIKPAGYGFGHVRKAHKYLFVSPAMRVALAHELGLPAVADSIASPEFRGRLLEDAVATYLKRIFVERPVAGNLEYDISKGGADFIVSKTGFRKDAVVIEVGSHKLSSEQVVKTLAGGGRYGLVVTGRPHLELQNTKVIRTRFEIDNRVGFIALPIFLLL